jgi:SAM-dependent methyltransferase
MDLRDRIRNGLDFKNKTTLEIGPLYRPFVLKSEGQVVYVDHADTETLRKKYADDPLFDVSSIVEVDAVWGAQTLSECLGDGKKVDYVIASHVIEHTPDLITWLRELRSVLKAGGEIRLVIPDKRFTFDYTRRLTVLSDVADAYMRKARRPLPLYIIDHLTNVHYVDTAAAWSGALDADSLVPYHSFELAMGVGRDALETDHYHDVHCWVFTPHSFTNLMCEMAENDLIDLGCTFFGDTEVNSLEFTAFLCPSDDKKFIVDSWRRAAVSIDRSGPRSFDKYQCYPNEVSSNERALQSALAEAEAAIEAYVSSTSWRITAPLRALSRKIRR